MKLTAKKIKTVLIIVYVLIAATLNIIFLNLPKDENRDRDFLRTFQLLVMLAFAFIIIYKKRKNKESKGI